MNDPAVQGIPAPEQAPPSAPSPTPDPPPPAEEPWLLHYAGTEQLTKGGYTWQPDEVVEVPESVARTLFGADNLRVVRDPELRDALANRQTP